MLGKTVEKWRKKIVFFFNFQKKTGLEVLDIFTEYTYKYFIYQCRTSYIFNYYTYYFLNDKVKTWKSTFLFYFMLYMKNI